MTEFRGILMFVLAMPLLLAAPTPASPEAAAAPTTCAANPSDEEPTALFALNVTYYSNALHTTIVGRFGYDCCNNKVAWGKKSQFASTGGCFPCFPPPI
jgi:hypothetical protein